jgi:hypothetical protein
MAPKICSVPSEDRLCRKGCRQQEARHARGVVCLRPRAASAQRAGRDDLSSKVEWVAQTIGDGLGFDILSFDGADDSERMLEVKTTGLGKFFPFYVTANEVRCSDDIPDQYHLFRVFDMGREPRIYILHLSLKILCQFEPVLFRAVI